MTTVIQNVTAIIIASAAAIGLVPLGVKTVVDMIRNRRRKKDADMWTTVLVSVIAANIAPPVLTELLQRLGAAADRLPPPLKALLGTTPQHPGAQAPEAAPDSEAGQPAPDPSGDGRVPSPD